MLVLYAVAKSGDIRTAFQKNSSGIWSGENQENESA